MAIKIATMIGDNYGSALQAFALQQSIKECGGGASILKLRPKSYIIRFVKTYLIPTKYDGVKKKARKAVSDLKNRKKRRKVREFYQKNIVVEIHRTIEELLSNEKGLRLSVEAIRFGILNFNLINFSIWIFQPN